MSHENTTSLNFKIIAVMVPEKSMTKNQLERKKRGTIKENDEYVSYTIQ